MRNVYKPKIMLLTKSKLVTKFEMKLMKCFLTNFFTMGYTYKLKKYIYSQNIALVINLQNAFKLTLLISVK